MIFRKDFYQNFQVYRFVETWVLIYQLKVEIYPKDKEQLLLKHKEGPFTHNFLTSTTVKQKILAIFKLFLL